MNILVVAAHPDDEVLGCGGTMVHHVRQGDKVFILITGEGITARYTHRDQANLLHLENLHVQTQKVADILGATKLFTHNFPDNRLDSVPLLDVIKVVEKVQQEVKPEMVYTHHRADLNIDHRILYHAVLTACRPMQKSRVRRILSFYNISSTEWNVPPPKDLFFPNVFVDITRSMKTKLKAMSIYKTELCKYPHPRSLKAIENTAKYWGNCVGFEAAEPFMLVRERIT
ncbi:PIG-L family deacetylase [Candidatus Woesearchaeota archaeon]|nr:PIG-L family deacetylase [Candidatus Woesearchaeota archaeon]